MKGITKAY